MYEIAPYQILKSPAIKEVETNTQHLLEGKDVVEDFSILIDEIFSPLKP